METFIPSTLRSKAYPVIVQNGTGSEMDRYIYSQSGEGLSSFFGSLMKNAVPVLGKFIKGGWNLSKPHITAAGKELISAGAKRGVEALTKTVSKPSGNKRSRTSTATKAIHRPHKKRKRAKWRSL